VGSRGLAVSNSGQWQSRPEHALRAILAPKGTRLGSLKAGYAFLVLSLCADPILAHLRLGIFWTHFWIHIRLYTRDKWLGLIIP